jgi:hypothetical protein
MTRTPACAFLYCTDFAMPGRLGEASLLNQANSGAISSFWPGAMTKSFPEDQTVSLIRSLNVTGSFTSLAQRQVLPSTQTRGCPCSQVKPAPCPRKKRALPKPTSNFTSIVVRMVLGAPLDVGLGAGATGALAAVGAGAGVGALAIVGAAGAGALVIIGGLAATGGAAGVGAAATVLGAVEGV